MLSLGQSLAWKNLVWFRPCSRGKEKGEGMDVLKRTVMSEKKDGSSSDTRYPEGEGKKLGKRTLAWEG